MKTGQIGKQEEKIKMQGEKFDRRSKSCYQKYKCQYKKKSIFTKLNNYSGYPQEMLTIRGKDLRGGSNYVEKNKHNLKNFFKDRIPPENNMISSLMKSEVERIHPKRIFEIKQLQYELKTKTKMNLKNSFQVFVTPTVDSSFDKFDANFHITDKNRQLKMQYGGTRDFLKQQYKYDNQNFRRGTQSHIEKRTKLLKKQAYDKVFGPDISSLSRTAYFEKKNATIDYTPPRAKSISLSSPFEETSTHKNLRQLILKMHDYKNKLEETNGTLQMGQQVIHNTVQEESMVTLIQNMSKLYQEKAIQQGTHKIESIDDIANLSKNFYESMLQHKHHRLSKRKELAYQTISLTPHSPRDHSPSPRSQRIDPDHQSQFSDNNPQQEEQRQIVQQNYQIEDFSRSKNEVFNRFKLLKRTLVKWAALFYIYGIHKSDIFQAFSPNRGPYELQGSYAFFKCIKLGDLASVKLFLQNNRSYAFQCEYHGKSPISYAAYHNQTEVALSILQVGVNSDRLCNSGNTALYYAVKKGNVVMVRELLQKGACPWSNEKNPYKEMIRTCQNSEKLQRLFNNARKVFLGMQIQQCINKRKQYWDKNHHRIVQSQTIYYSRTP